ncbi:hypothetical protein F3D71_15090 [Bacteroides ovatus]|uniref:Uncharacterized protein n=1 Tax=Bacteroides ovatus TaxID=28116 RepID=A0A5M5C194_BACOV|nr:hypothetical protein F3D71_15090 [Bacteroides ovatus]
MFSFSMFFPFLLFAKLANNRENRMSHTSSDLFDMSFIAKLLAIINVNGENRTFMEGNWSLLPCSFLLLLSRI